MNNQTKTLLLQQDYDIQGTTVVFSLYRKTGKLPEISSAETHPSYAHPAEAELTYQFQIPDSEEITCKRIFYPQEAESFQSPYLSWYNLICCSNNYGPIPVLSYMNYAVQNGKKLAATIYPESVSEYQQLLRDCTEGFYCFPWHIEEYQYMLYISRTGTLADYFDIGKVLAIYEAGGICLDKEKMETYCSQELSWFANEQLCPIEIHNCLGAEELAAVGLLFGYPVESTIALINKTIDMCE